MKKFGYYTLCTLAIVLGLVILLPCAFGVYKSGMWTWTNVEMLSDGGHPLNGTLAVVVGILGLVAVLTTASGSLGGLALIIAGLVALNQEPWSQSAFAVRPTTAETATTAATTPETTSETTSETESEPPTTTPTEAETTAVTEAPRP